MLDDLLPALVVEPVDVARIGAEEDEVVGEARELAGPELVDARLEPLPLPRLAAERAAERTGLALGACGRPASSTTPSNGRFSISAKLLAQPLAIADGPSRWR